MKTIKRKQLVGEIVRLENHYRIYGNEGIFYITTNNEEAYRIATCLIREEEIK